MQTTYFSHLPQACHLNIDNRSNFEMLRKNGVLDRTARQTITRNAAQYLTAKGACGAFV
jgi:hypothetical protein